MQEKVIWFASSNAHKAAEMQRMIGPSVVVKLPKEAGISFDPDETGSTFAENALIKARALWDQVKAPVLADDSGLVVDALGGRPGIHTARYGCEGGKKLTSQEQYTLLLKEMEGVEDRSARFVAACVLMLSPDRYLLSQETFEGEIALEARGLHGFGYDPVFIAAGTGRTASELEDREKDALSHRGRAMRAVRREMEELIANEEI